MATTALHKFAWARFTDCERVPSCAEPQAPLADSGWARLPFPVVRQVTGKDPTSQCSYTYDDTTHNASLKMLGRTYRCSAYSDVRPPRAPEVAAERARTDALNTYPHHLLSCVQAEGREGCAREAIKEELLPKIILEAKVYPPSKEAEFKRLARTYGNLNRLPSMAELYPPPSMPTSATSGSFSQSSYGGGAGGGGGYQGVPPNIASLLTESPNTAFDRLQHFLADIYSHDSSLFDRIEFAQARLGQTPWSVSILGRTYSGTETYADRQIGKEAALRAAFEQGALSALVADCPPEPAYHGPALDLVAKFNNPAGLHPLPPPIPTVAPGPGPMGGQSPYHSYAAVRSPYVQHGMGGMPMNAGMGMPIGAVSPYHNPTMVMNGAASPYHAAMSPYHAQSGSFSQPPEYGPSTSAVQPLAERNSRKRERSRSGHSRSYSKGRSRSRRSSHRRRRRASTVSSDDSGSSEDGERRGRSRSRSISRSTSRSRSRSRSRSEDSDDRHRRRSNRKSSRHRTYRRHRRSHRRRRDEDEAERPAEKRHRDRCKRKRRGKLAAQAGADDAVRSGDGLQGQPARSQLPAVVPELNYELAPYLDFILDALDGAPMPKVESPEVTLDAPIPIVSPLMARLDSRNREKLESIQDAAGLAVIMRSVHSAAFRPDGSPADA